MRTNDNVKQPIFNQNKISIFLKRLFNKISLALKESLDVTSEAIAYSDQTVLIDVGHHVQDGSLQCVCGIMEPLHLDNTPKDSNQDNKKATC